MKIKSFLPALLAAIVITITTGSSGGSGCENPEISAAKTRNNLLNPEVIGITEDGLQVRRYEVDIPNRDSHFIYRLGNLPAATINYEMPEGKTKSLKVVVLVEDQAFTNEIKVQY
jgi:hypothetical protein